MSRSTCLTLVAAMLCAPALHPQAAPPLVAAAPSSAALPALVTTLTAAIRTELIQTATTQLAQSYVDEKVGRDIGELLKQQLQAGAYDRLDNPAQFAEAVTRDLQKTNGDLHLTLRYSPAPAAPGGQAGFDPFAGARQQNFGITRAEILEGNIGYLEFTGFLQASGWEEALVDALRFLGRTDAVIIDLRRNGGGSGHMGDFLLSHFLGAKPVPTVKIKSRQSPEPFVVQSMAEVPGPRRPEVPLYILASQGTGSAAEAFAFVLKNLRRATVVGTRTAGAGHMVGFLPAGHGFTLGFSITNVSDPRTGLQWEQVGVQPDITVPAERALKEAHVTALRRLLDTTPDPNRNRTLKRVLAMAEARRQPQPIDEGKTARCAGTYEGRVVTVSEGHVTYARIAGAMPEELIHLGSGQFALGSTLLRFEEREGKATLLLERADGTSVSFPRSAPQPSH